MAHSAATADACVTFDLQRTALIRGPLAPWYGVGSVRRGGTRCGCSTCGNGETPPPHAKPALEDLRHNRELLGEERIVALLSWNDGACIVSILAGHAASNALTAGSSMPGSTRNIRGSPDGVFGNR